MPTLGEVFDRNPNPVSFRTAVEAFGGDFPFDTAAMISLGEAYFRLFPDSARDRNRETVLIGYDLVRICVTERLLRALAPERREFFRAAFREPASAGMPAGRFPAEALAADLASVEAEMSAIRIEIEGIPKGPIKERFVGGISQLCTVLYLVRMHLNQKGATP
ncbi:MAG: hypothetical protein JW843_12740 [Candidatus Aminicenantes bacterium]|nr:hypothetical protein [Candidatus Aminicenantes bacterium]